MYKYSCIMQTYSKSKNKFHTKEAIIMKHNTIKKLALLLAALTLLCTVLTGCGEDTIVVQTNAYFAPFEYYDGNVIKGVDVDIMNKVGEKMGKKVEFVQTEFSAIIDNVKEGKVCECGAAGITATDARKEKVDFSVTYFVSVQYVIYQKSAAPATVDNKYILWEALSGKKVGVQTDTTGAIYLDGEINAQAGNDYGYDGVLYGSGTEQINYDNVQIAVEALKAGYCDYIIIDKLPAQYVVNADATLGCLPLYYAGGDGEDDFPVSEDYAIAVNKEQKELLAAINEVLNGMLENGEVDALIMKHMGLDQ